MLTPFDFDVPCVAPVDKALAAVAEHLRSLGYEETARTVDSVTLKFTGKLLTLHLDEARHQTKVIATGHSLHVHVTWPWWLSGVLGEGERKTLREQAEGAARASAAKASG